MGLDVTAHEEIERYDGDVQYDDDYPDEIDWRWMEDNDLFRVSQIDAFKGREDGMDLDSLYRSLGRTKTFRAGAYSGYNNFRNKIAQVVVDEFNLMTVTGDKASHNAFRTVIQEPTYIGLRELDAPFVELINFADNEGVIGPKTCSKLANDFEEHEEKFSDMFGQGVGPTNDVPKAMRRYKDWKEAFKLAANTGCVKFH